MSFKELNIKPSYESGQDNIVEDFYIPSLSQAVFYDRIAGFFSSTSLAVAARGLAEFIKNNGKMRLICSPILQQSDTAIIKRFINEPESLNAHDLGIDLDRIENEFIKNHVKALGWLLKEGRLEIILALAVNSTGDLQTIEDGTGIFHQKVGIMQDALGNEISFSGSINESATAWLENIEEFKVFKAWDISHDYFQSDKDKFQEIWNGQRKNLKVFNLPTAIKDDLITYSKDFDRESIAIERYREVKENMSKFNHNAIPLFPYQSEALKKWEANNCHLLFEMATGTGKTRTAIAGISYLMKKNRKLIVIIACPQNTLSLQWKDEIEKLNVNFGFDIIADGTNPKWKQDLDTLLLKVKTGFVNHCAIYTTHFTASSDTFTSILKKYETDNLEVLFIGDEVHWLGAPKLRESLLPFYKYRIGLSATPSRWFDDYGTRLLEQYFGNDHFEFTIKDALHNINPLTGKTFLVNYYYLIKHVPLMPNEADEYVNLTKRIVSLYQNKDKSPEDAINYERLLDRRANIIKNAELKYQMLAVILDELSANKKLENTIIFVSPQQINRVMNILTEKNIVYHKLTQEEGTKPEANYGGKTEREYIIKRFKEKSFKVLIAIKCLDEGIDIPSASCGILMASSTSPREYIQRVGRIIRQDENKSFAYLYDICVDSIDGICNYSEIEKKIRLKEQLRMREIAENAINSFDAISNILNL